MTAQQKEFLTYIRTLQMFELRFKGEAAGIKPVHVKAEKVAEFFPTNKQAHLQDLESLGELQIIKKDLPNGWTKHYYSVTKAGEINFDLIPKRELPNDPLSRIMIAHLKNVSLPDGAESTSYFDTFLRNKENHMDKFVTIDDFGKRFHSPVTSFNRDLRPYLLINGESTISIDIVQSQPTILAIILNEAIGANEFSNWIEEGKDIYEMIQEKAGLSTRDEAKKAFFEVLFSRPSDKLAKTFGDAVWIRWINSLKRTKLEANPHGKNPHTNMAFLLQRCESRTMRKVWQALASAGISFLTIHDEIRTTTEHAPEAETIIKETLYKEYHAFKVSSKGIAPAKTDNATTAKEMTLFEWQKSELMAILDQIELFNNPEKLINKLLFT